MDNPHASTVLTLQLDASNALRIMCELTGSRVCHCGRDPPIALSIIVYQIGDILFDFRIYDPSFGIVASAASLLAGGFLER